MNNLKTAPSHRSVNTRHTRWAAAILDAEGTAAAYQNEPPDVCARRCACARYDLLTCVCFMDVSTRCQLNTVLSIAPCDDTAKQYEDRSTSDEEPCLSQFVSRE
jgi:hypothetical protein